MRVIGIDLGMRKVAFSVWDDDKLVETNAYASQAMDWTEVYRDLGDWIRHAVYHLEPDYVFIEDIIIGNNRKYSIGLAKTFGAVVGKLAAYKVIPVNNTVWKKEILGKGNATKDLVRDYLYSRDSAYSVICGNDQDQWDAACIGFYGFVISKRAQGLTLVPKS